jgi:Zn-dependent protease
VHLLRSIGGPLMNVLLGGLGLLLWQVTGHPVALFFMLFNWILTVILLLPFATVDGEVIWRELPKLRR